MPPSHNFARVTIWGTFWNHAAFYSGKLMVFISTVILARLLLQEDFGVVGYAIIVINFLDVFRDLGIGPALIYHRDSPEASDTAFWIGIAVGIMLFGVTWAGAPLVGDFFQDDRATPIIRVLGLSFPIIALGNVHDSLLRKNLAFGRGFIPRLAQSISKGALSIALAFMGFGAWSLVFGQLAGVLVATIAFWWVMPWRPRLRFVPDTARPLLTYGTSTVLLNLLAAFVSNVDYLFVGRYMGAAALGVYTLAFRIPQLLIIQFCEPISRAIFPVYSRMQDDPHALRRGFLATTRYVALITVPMGLGLALLAEPFVLVFYGSDWSEAIPVMQAIAIYAMMLSLAYNAGDVYKAQGRIYILTRISLLRAVLLVPGLWWAVTSLQTPWAVGWTNAVVAAIASVLGLIIAGRVLDTPIASILEALRPIIISSTVMALAVIGFLVLGKNLSPIMQLLFGVPVGALTYAAALWLFQRDLVLNAAQTLRTVLARR